MATSFAESASRLRRTSPIAVLVILLTTILGSTDARVSADTDPAVAAGSAVAVSADVDRAVAANSAVAVSADVDRAVAANSAVAVSADVDRAVSAREPALPDTSDFAAFVEPDFPFITTTLDADTLSSFVPAFNWTVRGLVIQLGGSVYAAFDPDLLRLSVAWKGEFMSLTTMAQVSYHRLDKDNANPRVLGEPIIANGMYSGWMGESLSFDDPRPSGDRPLDPGRGPIPVHLGRWKGLYLDGLDVVLSYGVLGSDVLERPGRIAFGAESVVTRTMRISPVERPLSLVVASVEGASVTSRDPYSVVLSHGADSVTAVGVDHAPPGSRLDVVDGRYVTFRIPPSDELHTYRVAAWTGHETDLDAFHRARQEPIRSIREPGAGGELRWREEVVTAVHEAPDTSAFVFDEVELPTRNPWRRNVRPADLDFFRDGRAAVITFDGDVWIVSDLSGASPAWRRYASGLYEPLAIAVVDEHVYAYGREGIVRLHDLNGNGEADFYEAFAHGIVQSTRSREWPFDLIPRPGGGFFATQGGALHSTADRDLTPVMPGFVAGSVHNGTILAISPDGRDVSVHATGFRAPYVGIHPVTGLLTASDQQGNFVPSTPIYAVEEGGYYGVPPTAHRPHPLPPAQEPITWIPHPVDPSGTSQVWITSERMGPLSGRLLHLSYGPGLFRVYVDSGAVPVQGGVAQIPRPRTKPILKAGLNPHDGLVYLCGFHVWGSRADALTSLERMRFTGLSESMPSHILAVRQGILLQFDAALEDAYTPELRVRRWNYLRSSQYGSGHFRLDGEPGEEELPVAGIHWSLDRTSLLILVPDMRLVMQMAVDYALRRPGGETVEGSVYLTVNHLRELDLQTFGFEPIDWLATLERAPGVRAVAEMPAAAPTALKGRHLYHELGCMACHSVEEAAGVLGPSFYGLYGSDRVLSDGRTVLADRAYLIRSILEPGSDVVAGFETSMPSYRGILGDSDLESIVLFIKSLATDGTE